MDHPDWGFALPSIVARLVARVQASPDPWRDGWERTYRALRPLPDADPALISLAFGDAGPSGGELDYLHHPPEIVPLFWNGGDALHYGLVWYDARLGPEHPAMVSYAPVDDGPGCWLGDDTSDGIRNLLAWYARGESAGTEWADEAQAEGLELAEALGLDLSGPLVLRRGARSDRRHAPAVPPGWRWVPGSDGVGTLAPASAFSSEPRTEHGSDLDAWLADGRRALADGSPGTALAAFREACRHAYEADERIGTAEALASAYDALGRGPLAARARAAVATLR